MANSIRRLQKFLDTCLTYAVAFLQITLQKCVILSACIRGAVLMSNGVPFKSLLVRFTSTNFTSQINSIHFKCFVVYPWVLDHLTL